MRRAERRAAKNLHCVRPATGDHRGAERRLCAAGGAVARPHKGVLFGKAGTLRTPGQTDDLLSCSLGLA